MLKYALYFFGGLVVFSIAFMALFLFVYYVVFNIFFKFWMNLVNRLIAYMKGE